MNQKNLLYLIIFDVILLVLTLGLFLYRYRSFGNAPAVRPVQSAQPLTRTVDSPFGSSSQETQTPRESKPAVRPSAKTGNAASRTRNIAFVYRNSRVKKVEIIGDFNGWVPTPLTKGADHRWAITIPIPPGEYAYNFVVDGKPIRDPNNPRSGDVGRGFPNSLLKVKPLAEERK